MLTIGDRIKTVRAGMTQREFADSLGITAQAVINYEKHGRTPRREVLNKISDVCGVSVDWLLTGADKGGGTGEDEKAKRLPGSRFEVREDAQPIEISQPEKMERLPGSRLAAAATSPDLLPRLLTALDDNAALLREIADLREARARLEARVRELESALHTHTSGGG